MFIKSTWGALPVGDIPISPCISVCQSVCLFPSHRPNEKRWFFPWIISLIPVYVLSPAQYSELNFRWSLKVTTTIPRTVTPDTWHFVKKQNSTENSKRTYHIHRTTRYEVTPSRNHEINLPPQPRPKTANQRRGNWSSVIVVCTVNQAKQSKDPCWHRPYTNTLQFRQS